jgi:hypothetical protein
MMYRESQESAMVTEVSPWATLVPVIVGGVIGFASGFFGPWFLERRKETAEKKRKRAEKFEELVAAVYEHDHWIDTLRRIHVLQFEGEITVSPFAKIQAISDVYFPQFEKAVEDLATAALAYRMWMYEVAQHKPETKEELYAGHKKIVEPYMQKQKALLAVLKTFARQEFQ